MTEDYEWQAHELELLAEACRALDVITELAAIIAREGVTASGSMGQPVVHPAVGELRQQQQALAKMLTILNVPPLDDAAGIESPLQTRGRLAAQSRWGETRGRR
ncbi:MAG: hypothetical protein ACO1N6_08795 [Microcella sp.]